MRRTIARFPTTQWDCVAEAGDPAQPGADEALARICRSYWYPIYSFIRSRVRSADEAADLTQDYFARLLEGRLLAAADRRKGRFRTLLRTDCLFFLADRREMRSARKRGGGRRGFSLDAAAADHRYHLEPSDRLDAETLFDRAWAMDVLGRALERLARQEAEAGRGEAFGHFRPLLVDGPRSVSYASLAARLGCTEAAVDGALRRLRHRYRRALRATVAETLDEPGEASVDAEIRDLFAALGR
jgi:RNA polymerase sigma-70 factor (ECF subfamily)